MTFFADIKQNDRKEKKLEAKKKKKQKFEDHCETKLMAVLNMTLLNAILMKPKYVDNFDTLIWQ